MTNKFCIYCGNKLTPGKDCCDDCKEKIFDGNLDPKEFYIEHCNTKIPAEATYCPVCGSKVLDVREKEVVHKELAKKAIPTYEKEVVDQNEGLFSNTGNRIKGFAKLFLFLNFIISIGIAYLVYAFLDGISREDISILPALLTFVVTFIIGWLFSLLIYGFGQMIDYQKRILDELLKISKKLK